MSALARRILPICLISGRCAPDCGMAQHGDGAVAWMVGASRPSPGQKDGTGALFAKPPPAHARGHRLTSSSVARRVGNTCDSTRRSRWSTYDETQSQIYEQTEY